MIGSDWKCGRKVSHGGTPAAVLPAEWLAGILAAFDSSPSFMDPAQKALLRQIIETQEIGALGTLHDGRPFVSMVPFALDTSSRFLIHVSRLASHTKDMLTDPEVSLMVTAVREAGMPAQATARITVQGRAVQCRPGTAEEDLARIAYLGRFPESEPMFGFGDFSLFVIKPSSIRFVGGFAQARSLSPGAFAEALES